MTGEPSQANHNDGTSASDTKLTVAVVGGVAALLLVWAYAIATAGFAAFIYPLLALVLLAFVFTLSLTRG